jgi:hypothetical protein
MMQIQFPGGSANHFYKLIKQKKIPWEKLTKFDIVLSRFDLVYERRNKPTDKISATEFINSSFVEFQDLHPFKNLLAERNRKGLLFKIGHRKGRRHYRIYTGKHPNSLRFEAEMKGDLIKDFRDLLIAATFEQHDFESRLSYQFFKYSFEIFSSLNQSSHIDWLAARIRPYQYRNAFSSELAIHSDYLNQMDYKLLKEKQHLITLLRLLAYVKKLKYTNKSLTSEFRRYRFPLRDFLNYNNLTPNYYQVKKLKTFFDMVKTNFVIESFSNKHYHMLITIPEVSVYKSEQNILMVEVWIAEELFNYLHPFLFSDLFQQKLTKHQFQVLFEIIKTYTSIHLRKEFNIQQFIHSYPSTLNGKLKIKIKEHFIQYLQVLENQLKIKAKVLLLPSNEIHNIHQLTYNHLRKNKTIVAFEIIDI